MEKLDSACDWVLPRSKKIAPFKLLTLSYNLLICSNCLDAVNFLLKEPH